MSDRSPTPIRLDVELWVRPGGHAAFHAFEAQALALMKQHGAQILSIKRYLPRHKDEPNEVHRLEFPSNQALQAYRNDERLQALAPLRAKGVLRTEIKIH